MTPVLLLSPYDVEDEPEPHAELVAAQRPGRAAFMRALATVGAWPDGSYLGGSDRIPLAGGGRG